jgi:lipooligosaccharide transport system permease protein
VPQESYAAMLATPLEVDDIIAGELLWCGCKALFAGGAILLVATLLGAVADARALLAIPVIFLAGLCFAGPAIVMSALSPSYDFFAYYQTLLLTPMFILCGVFYPTSTLPESLQQFIQVLPLTHAVALIRPLVAGLPLDAVLLPLAVLAAYALVFFYLAVLLVRRRLVV